MEDEISPGLGYYRAHRDEQRERMSKWRRENRERKLAYDRAYRAARREDHRRWAAEWALRNPDRAACIATAGRANTRARRAGVGGRLSVDDVAGLWERQPLCVACGVGRGLDHVVPLRSGGVNDPSNIQNLCPGCNSRANARTLGRSAGRFA